MIVYNICKVNNLVRVSCCLNKEKVIHTAIIKCLLLGEVSMELCIL